LGLGKLLTGLGLKKFKKSWTFACPKKISTPQWVGCFLKLTCLQKKNGIKEYIILTFISLIHPIKELLAKHFTLLCTYIYL
jgi:hypothetical protein